MKHPRTAVILGAALAVAVAALSTQPVDLRAQARNVD